MALGGAIGEDEASGAGLRHAFAAQAAAVAAADFGQLGHGGLEIHDDPWRRAVDSGQHCSSGFLAAG